MNTTRAYLASIFAVTAPLLLVGCGGSSPPTSANAATASALFSFPVEDKFTFAGELTGNGSGIWSGDASPSDGGDGDSAGAAGDGEFVKVNMKFPYAGNPNGTLKWTVLRSQYGADGATGTLTIQKDASSSGGYKITAVNGVSTAVRSTQANFFVSQSGQLCGSLPLPIGAVGAVKDVLYNGVRLKDGTSTATDMSEWAGTYAYGLTVSDIKTGANKSMGAGVLKINSNGTGRLCSETVNWSSTCTDGIDISAAFNDPSNRNLIRILSASTQSQPISAGVLTSVDMLATARKFGMDGGVSMSGDFVVSGTNRTSRTGAVYASRIGSMPADPMMMAGAWNYVGTMVKSSDSTMPIKSTLGISSVGGVVKMRSKLDGQACDASSSALAAGPVNGVVTMTSPMNPAMPNYVMMLDTDLALVVMPNSEVGLARRYSMDVAKAPCQPS